MRQFLIGLILLVTTNVYAKDTIVVVIDASLSMTDTVETKNGNMSRMEVAKQSLKRVLPNIQGDVDLGIVVFSAGNLPTKESEWVYPIKPIIKNQVIAAIDKPNPSGGTPLGDYIKIGGDKLLERRMKSGNSGRYRLILVTDGETNEGFDANVALQDAKRKGIMTDLIGLGMTGEHSLAKLIVSLPTPGTYQSAQDAEQLVEAMAKVTKEAPTTKDGSIDPVVFEETLPLKDEISDVMIKTISSYNNSPIGEPDISVLPITAAIQVISDGFRLGVLIFIGVIILGIFAITVIKMICG